MPNPRFRPKLQSTPPPGATTPLTCRPSCCSKRRPPGHKLETETIIDHGEPTRRQRDALAIDSGDVLAFGGRAMREASLCGEF